MKNSHKLLAALVLSIASICMAFAEPETPTKEGHPMGMGDKMKEGHGKGMGMKDKAQNTENQKGVPDADNGVMMKEGKMMMMTKGKSEMMKNHTTMNNGSIVTTDGMVTMKDGSKTVMKEGDKMTMDGKMTNTTK